MATLNNAIPTTVLTADDLRFLTFAQHMAETAQSDEARHLFQEFLQMERVRLKTRIGLGLGAGTPCRTPVMAVRA
jgi:hypothetical protein